VEYLEIRVGQSDQSDGDPGFEPVSKSDFDRLTQLKEFRVYQNGSDPITQILFAEDAELPVSVEKVRLDFSWSQVDNAASQTDCVFYPVNLLNRASELRNLTFAGAVAIPTGFKLNAPKLQHLRFEKQFDFNLPANMLESAPQLQTLVFDGDFNRTVPDGFLDHLKKNPVYPVTVSFLSPKFLQKAPKFGENVMVLLPNGRS
jgi:hypothetical protein